ncbi:MAG: AraC family transcriptional regulator [Steroidobacteraceae bacterium]
MIRVSVHDKIYPANKLTTIMDALAREGVPMVDAMQGLQLSPSALHSRKTLVSLNQVMQGCRNAARLSPDPHFAYHTGLRFHLSAFGMYGFAILSSTTFRQMTDIATKYYQLTTPMLDTSFRQEQGCGIWTLQPLPHGDIEPRLFKFIVELDLGTIISLYRDILGQSFVPKQIHLSFGAPRDAAIYPEMFGCPVLFGQPESGLVFDAAWLEGNPRLGHEISHQETVKLCDELMEQLALRVGLAGKVRELLLMNRTWELSCGSVARQLHMAERTLRRKLRKEKTSFRQLVAELRMHLTTRYLRDTELSVQEIAHALGFSEDASFRYALRRWTRAAPLELRDRLRKRMRA